jgi:hypothetical protein
VRIIGRRGCLDIFVVPNVMEETAKLTSKPELLLLGRPEQLTERQAQLWLEQRDRFGREKGRSPSTKRWAQKYSPTGVSAA